MNSPLSFAHFSPWPFHRTRLAAPPGSSYDPEQTNIVRIGKGKDASCNTICKGLLVSGGFSSVESVWVGRMFPTFEWSSFPVYHVLRVTLALHIT